MIDSDGESDLCLYHHQTFSCSSFEGEKGKNKSSEIALVSENNQTNSTNCCKNCPLLHVQRLENTRDFQVELSPESVLQFTFEGYQTSDYPSRAYSCDGSCQDILCLSSGIPPLIITEKSVQQPAFHTVQELYQKQAPADCLVTSSHKKSVQVSFSCTERDISENTEGKCFKPSLVPDETNKTPVKESLTFHRYHGSIRNKNETSSQLIIEPLDYSSESQDKTNSPQSPECICPCVGSGDLVISLTLEAAYPTDSLAGSITASEAKLSAEDSRRHALAFKFKGPEHNQVFQKLCISVIPNSVHSVHLNTESLKQTAPYTKQTGLPQILAHGASQPLSTQTDSSESSSSDFCPDQVPFTLKPQASSLSSLSSKHTHVKVFRPMKSVVFPKNKEVHKDRKIRNRSYSSSKFHWHTAWDIESINQSIHNYKTEEELKINELCYYVPQTQTITCCCSPLLDLSVNLNSERRCSGSEKLLGINRKLHKRTGGAKVMPRFFPQYLLNPRSSFERLYYISPTRKKNYLKMQNILHHCLGCTGGQNRHESCKEKICPIVDCSNTRHHGLFTPHLSTDVRSTAPLLSSTWNSPAPPPHAGSVPNERRCSPVPCLQRPTGSPAALCSLRHERWQSPASCLQTERDTYPVALYSLPNERRYSPAPCLQTKKENRHYPDGKCHVSHSPCASIVNVMQPWKERNTFHMEEVDSSANLGACGDLALKKLLVCSCGNMPQCGLFPNGDISQSVSTKARKSPDTTQRASLIKSDTVVYPRGTFQTMETCCCKCHNLFPSHSKHNICRQGYLRSQFTKAQSYFEDGFPMKNLKEDVQKNKEVKTAERKNVRIHAGPGTSQQTGPLSPSNGYSVPKYAVYEPKCCSCCPAIVKKLCGTSREALTSFGSKHKLLENCLNRQQAFLAEPCKGTRTRCTCSQEVPLFCVDQTDIYERNRTALPRRMTSENTQVCTSS